MRRLLIGAAVFTVLFGTAAAMADEPIILHCEGQGVFINSSLHASIPATVSAYYRITLTTFEIFSDKTGKFSANVCEEKWYKCDLSQAKYSYSFNVPNKNGHGFVMTDGVSIDQKTGNYVSSTALMNGESHQDITGLCRQSQAPAPSP